MLLVAPEASVTSMIPTHVTSFIRILNRIHFWPRQYEDLHCEITAMRRGYWYTPAPTCARAQISAYAKCIRHRRGAQGGVFECFNTHGSGKNIARITNRLQSPLAHERLVKPSRVSPKWTIWDNCLSDTPSELKKIECVDPMFSHRKAVDFQLVWLTNCYQHAARVVVAVLGTKNPTSQLCAIER
jgi:hypothetical protein